MSLFFYFKVANLIKEPLLEVGYTIGIVGFLGALLGVLFTSAGQFSSEMGNLETLGFKRSRYILFYLIQYLVVSSVAFLLGIVTFVVFYSTEKFATLEPMQLVKVLALTLALLFILFIVFVTLFFFLHKQINFTTKLWEQH